MTNNISSTDDPR